MRAAVRRFLTRGEQGFPVRDRSAMMAAVCFFEERANREGRRIWRRGYVQHGVLEKVYAGHCLVLEKRQSCPKPLRDFRKGRDGGGVPLKGFQDWTSGMIDALPTGA